MHIVWTKFAHAFFPVGIGLRLLIGLVAVAVYDSAVALVLRHFDVQSFTWETEAALVNGVILGLLMGFRNRAAYDRWWEARRLWGQLVNDTRNLALKVKAYVPGDAAAAARLPEALAGFAEALKRHLRGPVRLQDISGFESDPAAPDHVPLHLAGRVYDCVAAWHRDGLIDPMTARMLDTNAQALMGVCGGCERIRNTPVVPSYVAMLRLGLALNILAIPWLTLRESGLWGLPVLLLVCFFLLGVELVDTVIENPFGPEPDDLALDRYCRTIAESVAAVLGPDPKPGHARG
jgi:putative membrane protein